MRLISRFLIAGALAVLAAPGMASGFIYDCTLTKGAKSGTWISPKLAIILRNDGTVHVIDEVLLGFEQSPKQARVGRFTDNLLVARWSVSHTVDRKGQRAPRFDYDLRLNRKTGRIAVGARPYGYDNSFAGRGNCVKRNGKG